MRNKLSFSHTIEILLHRGDKFFEDIYDYIFVGTSFIPQEVITSALCFGLFYQPANQSANLAKHHLEQVAVILLAYVGYILINLVFIVARCLNDKIPFRVGALFSLVAALLNVTSGILLIVNRTNKFQGMYYEPHKYLESMLSAATVLSFINAVFFSGDAVYTFILKQNF
ncbi:hypothetical protein ABEB36_009749 [Hypothenemus hampei]|uniref:Uncharacterized protein n=1 Tax=Hypothenemus hampei TaxID=57062 RepID=A0ABD1EHG3_HYPHA